MQVLVGDLQGCHTEWTDLMARLGFSPSRHQMLLLGDLVNRGPDSLAVLRQAMALGDALQVVLGNHDIHLLARAAGVRAAGRGDTLDALLAAPDAPALLDWLRTRPLATELGGWLAVHAGVLPTWSRAQTLRLAAEVQAELSSPGWRDYLGQVFGNEPRVWHESLRGADRHRCIINTLTRVRFVGPDGALDFSTGDGHIPGQQPAHLLPWFDAPGRATAGERIAFGHWSTLGLLQRPGLLGLDTGCVWGGRLSAAVLGEATVEIVQVASRQKAFTAQTAVARPLTAQSATDPRPWPVRPGSR
ncbi:symmetrical bis(5'-nucleosyl)-tetraphosphatase [Amphibiibacter pelophylacis]|uniref:Symmetrical bis(5'-nucleosyl)-tetraphosphatase n=1 Tax=Amphibiibacter pelophylacis TaxID=1799477 RepID=A0ACC6P5C1_9BURK